MTPPRIFGHRGACADAPENTMAAFAAALDQGADGIEFDVQLTLDGVPVVYHDRSLHKVGRRGRIGTHTLEQLRTMDFGRWFADRFAGEPIPTLQEVLARFAGVTELAIELKAEGEPPDRVHALVAQVAAALRRRRVAAGIHILCFDGAVLAQMAVLAPQLSYVRNVDVRPAQVARVLGLAKTLCLPARRVDRGLADALRRRGAKLWVYRCDVPRNLHRARLAQVDAIITDRPAWVRQSLAPKP